MTRRNNARLSAKELDLCFSNISSQRRARRPPHKSFCRGLLDFSNNSCGIGILPALEGSYWRSLLDFSNNSCGVGILPAFEVSYCRGLLLLGKIICTIALTIPLVLALQIPSAIASASPASGLEALHHHPVSTRNALAQLNFDRGLTLVYAFNHQEAVRAFQRAAELDPQLAMAQWGIALAQGADINTGNEPIDQKDAYEAVQKALSLASTAPEKERAYIEALAKRYSKDANADTQQLAKDYEKAMGELVKRYPDDLDAATLYAESIMSVQSWYLLWDKNGKPKQRTEEIISLLESVLKRNPSHIGANHYYIHAMESSPHPEVALNSATRLQNLPRKAGYGHLLHMPSHIFSRIGDRETAIKINNLAIEDDRSYLKDSGMQGMYPVKYYNHNLHFLSMDYSKAGQFADALKVAEDLVANYAEHFLEMPSLELFMTTPVFVLVQFQKWDDLMRLPEPKKEMTMTNALLHFGRSMAYAASGLISDAQAERKIFIEARVRIPDDAEFGNNSASSILNIAQLVLDSQIAIAKDDIRQAIELLKKAVETEDALNYDEPPNWFLPIRELLGGVLMHNGNYVEAEQVFQADLERNPGNGRSLFGLFKSLEAQGKTSDAQSIKREFDTAWKNADTQLSLE